MTREDGGFEERSDIGLSKEDLGHSSYVTMDENIGCYSGKQECVTATRWLMKIRRMRGDR